MIGADITSSLGVSYSVHFYGLDLAFGLIFGGMVISSFLSQIRGMIK